jgi:hypothetical protein
VARTRSRQEVTTAVLVAVGIVLLTVLLIWLLRPATPGVPGSGGLMTRQPRASLLIVLTLGTMVFVVWRIARDQRPKKRLDWRQRTAIGVVVVFGLAFLAGVFWPGGLLRHYPSQPEPVTLPESSATSTPGTTGASTTVTTGSP